MDCTEIGGVLLRAPRKMNDVEMYSRALGAWVFMTLRFVGGNAFRVNWPFLYF